MILPSVICPLTAIAGAAPIPKIMTPAITVAPNETTVFLNDLIIAPSLVIT